MKSTGCGMSSIQAYKAHKQEGSHDSSNNTGKQGAQTRAGHLRIPKHPYISGCMIIVGYANQFKVTTN